MGADGEKVLSGTVGKDTQKLGVLLRLYTKDVPSYAVIGHTNRCAGLYQVIYAGFLAGICKKVA
jgi:hypothetical protein